MNISSVNGKGNGVNETPSKIPERTRSSHSLFRFFLSSLLKGILYLLKNFKFIFLFSKIKSDNEK